MADGQGRVAWRGQVAIARPTWGARSSPCARAHFAGWCAEGEALAELRPILPLLFRRLDAQPAATPRPTAGCWPSGYRGAGGGRPWLARLARALAAPAGPPCRHRLADPGGAGRGGGRGGRARWPGRAARRPGAPGSPWPARASAGSSPTGCEAAAGTWTRAPRPAGVDCPRILETPDMDDTLKQALALGRGYYLKKEYALAEQYLTEVVERNQSFADVYNMLGVIYHDQGQYQKAQRAFEAALKLNPGYTDAALNLAVTYNDTGRYKDAQETYRHALSRSGATHGKLDRFVAGKLANMYADIGDVYLSSGMYPEAIGRATGGP